MKRFVTNLGMFFAVVGVGVLMASAVSRGDEGPAKPALDYHHDLFEALDRRDVKALNGFFADKTSAEPLLFVPGNDGKPITLEGERAVADWVQLWSPADATAQTVITDCQVIGEADSPTATVIEFERRVPGKSVAPGSTERYRCTALMAPSNRPTGKAVRDRSRIYHLHISEANAPKP